MIARQSVIVRSQGCDKLTILHHMASLETLLSTKLVQGLLLFFLLFPILRRLVYVDYSGALRFNDVMEASTSKLLTFVQDQQRRLQFDDPINIQFTSVRYVPCYWFSIDRNAFHRT